MNKLHISVHISLESELRTVTEETSRDPCNATKPITTVCSVPYNIRPKRFFASRPVFKLSSLARKTASGRTCGDQEGKKEIYGVGGVIIMHRLTRRAVQVERHCSNPACKLLRAQKVEGRAFQRKVNCASGALSVSKAARTTVLPMLCIGQGSRARRGTSSVSSRVDFRTRENREELKSFLFGRLERSCGFLNVKSLIIF